MSNPRDLVSAHRFLNPKPAGADLWESYVTFVETSSTVQAVVWATRKAAGATSTGGDREATASGPLVTFDFTNPDDPTRDKCRAMAMDKLLNQLIATMPAGSWPNNFRQTDQK